MATSTLLKKLSIATVSTTLIFAAFTAQKAQAAAFTVTVEQPGIQQSTLATNPTGFGAVDVKVENFDSRATGNISTGNITSFTSTFGTYQNGEIRNADVYGGAGGTGKYYSPNKQSSSTLLLNSAQRYFGLWWSAGDWVNSGNKLDFYSGNTLINSFSTDDVTNFLATQSNATTYNGNPNAAYAGQNKTEPYAFLNFFADPNDSTVTFDKIVFTSWNFESDNHTVAANYRNISGTPIYETIPEPSATLGLLALFAFGANSAVKRKSQQKAMVKV